MVSDVSAEHDEKDFSWLRDAQALGSKLAFAVFREWCPLDDDHRTAAQFKLWLDECNRRFSDLGSRINADGIAEDPEAPPGWISVDRAFLDICNLPLKLVMAWAEANEAVGFHPDREAASQILIQSWSDHVRDGRDNLDQFESDVGRLARVVWAYNHRLVAASVLPEHFHDPENPLPDQPGMKSAFAIAAALSRGTRGHSGDVGMAGMEKWLKRFRQKRAVSASQNDKLWLRLNEKTLQLELVADPIKTALDHLPQTRGRPSRPPN